MNMSDNLNLTGTYFEGVEEFEPSAEDQKAYRDSCAGAEVNDNLSDNFTTHPAYRWACQHTGLSRTDRETFACYSNNYLYDRKPGEPMLFSQLMDVIYSKFLQFGTEP
jgi:hypothetical protein